MRPACRFGSSRSARALLAACGQAIPFVLGALLSCSPPTEGEDRSAAIAASSAPVAPVASPSASSKPTDRRAPSPVIAECLRTIDANPDPLHTDMTPSVQCLADAGQAAIPFLVDLLDAEGLGTRMRALNAMRMITRRNFGFDGTRWSDDGEARWRQWWASVGYDPQADPANRRDGISRIRARFGAE
jgi:hypothetical protein